MDKLAWPRSKTKNLLKSNLMRLSTKSQQRRHQPLKLQLPRLLQLKHQLLRPPQKLPQLGLGRLLHPQSQKQRKLRRLHQRRRSLLRKRKLPHHQSQLRRPQLLKLQPLRLQLPKPLQLMHLPLTPKILKFPPNKWLQPKLRLKHKLRHKFRPKLRLRLRLLPQLQRREKLSQLLTQMK